MDLLEKFNGGYGDVWSYTLLGLEGKETQNVGNNVPSCFESGEICQKSELLGEHMSI